MSKTSFRQPEYLGRVHQPTHRVRCAIHGFIHFSDAERAIVDHPLFQRLRWIRQLALTELIYPGATHSRFEHSLGVMEMATRIFDRLAVTNGGRMESVFRDVSELKEETLARARQICRLAALLHDLGHSCFSHAAEPVLHERSGHEALSVTILTSEDFLKKEIDSRFFEGCAELTASLIGKQRIAPQLKLLSDIVSGQIDADRTDYLLRDSHHCGVDYGRFDHRRLIETLTLWQHKDSGELELAIGRDGVHSFEALILARHQMNTQVYYHRLRRIYDYYLKEYFKCLDRSEFDSPQKILTWNDVRATSRMQESAKDEQSPGHEWARRMMTRNHHRDVFNLDESDGILALRKGEKVLNEIRKEYPDIEFLHDFPEKPVSIHNIVRPEDQDASGVDFPIIDQKRRYSIGERSQLLKTLPASWRVGFIFADISDRKRRDEITQKCRKIYGRC